MKEFFSFVCVCVKVCVRKSEYERESVWGKERERERCRGECREVGRGKVLLNEQSTEALRLLCILGFTDTFNQANGASSPSGVVLCCDDGGDGGSSGSGGGASSDGGGGLLYLHHPTSFPCNPAHGLLLFVCGLRCCCRIDYTPHTHSLVLCPLTPPLEHLISPALLSSSSIPASRTHVHMYMCF